MFLSVLGRVATMLITRPRTENTMVQVQWLVRTFIIIANEVMCAAMMKTRTMSWPQPNNSLPIGPNMIIPASAILVHVGCAILNCPIT